MALPSNFSDAQRADGIRARVTEKYEYEYTAEDVAKIADGIWAEFLKAFPRKEEHDPADLTEFYKEMQRKYKEFGQTYPIVLRYMCELGQYHKKAFRRYLGYIKQNPWKGVDSYLESQATYAKLLYMALNPRYDQTHAKNYYNIVLKALKEERKQFETETKENEENVNQDFENRKVRNQIELREFFAKYGMEAVDVPVRVVTDEKMVSDALVSSTQLAAEAAAEAAADELMAEIGEF